MAEHAHGRVPRELRRRQVLAEAKGLFVERGYQGASMEELAKRMGVSKPVVYALVGSKEALFRDVMAQVSEELSLRMAEAVAAERSLERRLHAGILAFLRYVAAERRGWKALLSMEAGPGSEEIVAIKRGQAQLVAALLGSGTGELDARRLEALALAVNGGVETVALWWETQPELTPETLAELLTKLYAPGLVALLGDGEAA